MNDINKLKSILSKSKAIMDKAEVEYGSTSNQGTQSTLSTLSHEKEMPNLTENYIQQNSNRVTQGVAPQNGSYRNIKTTKMPKHIVDAMVNNPIEIPESPYPTFELDQVDDLVNESQSPQPIQTAVAGPNQTYDSSSIRQIVREEIGGVVRKVVEEYLDKALITEDIQIKIGSTIFSGNLKPLPKKRKTKKRV